MPDWPSLRCMASSKRGGNPSSWAVMAFSGFVAPFWRNFSTIHWSRRRIRSRSLNNRLLRECYALCLSSSATSGPWMIFSKFLHCVDFDHGDATAVSISHDKEVVRLDEEFLVGFSGGDNLPFIAYFQGSVEAGISFSFCHVYTLFLHFLTNMRYC